MKAVLFAVLLLLPFAAVVAAPYKACKDRSTWKYCSPKNPKNPKSGSCGVCRDQNGAESAARDRKRQRK